MGNLVWINSVKPQFYIFFFRRFVLESYRVAQYNTQSVNRFRFVKRAGQGCCELGFHIRGALWEYDTTLKYW